jgi:hypothetical protein
VTAGDRCGLYLLCIWVMYNFCLKIVLKSAI